MTAASFARAAVFWAVRTRLGAAGQAPRLSGSLALLKRPRLGFGVLAIFLYVGAEVTIGSVLTNFLMQPQVLGLDQHAAGEHLSLYWGGAMVGRFTSARLPLRRGACPAAPSLVRTAQNTAARTASATAMAR